MRCRRPGRRRGRPSNPIGSSDVDATIKIRPGQPDSYHLEVTPQQETGILLKVDRTARPGPEALPPLELRMDDVTGRFVFDNGTVSMQDVGFLFHGSPVRFARGQVQVEDSGQFKLGVKELWAEELRLDAGLRKIMPPVMAQLRPPARRRQAVHDQGQPRPRLVGPGRPARLVPLGPRPGDLQRQLDPGRPAAGAHPGPARPRPRVLRRQDFEVHGALNLDSVSLLGQQITKLESPLHVEDGVARLEDIRGPLLGGTISGRVEVSLDATPQYAATIELQGADLERYAKTLPGQQTFRGQLAGRIALNGLGNDLRTLQGTGEAHITQGDLGELPIFLRLRQDPPAPAGDQDGVRLGRRRHLDPQRRVVPRPDQVHRQRLQPPGPGDARRPGGPRPPAPRPLRPRPVPPPRPQRRRPRGERPVPHRPRQGDPGQPHLQARSPPPALRRRPRHRPLPGQPPRRPLRHGAPIGSRSRAHAPLPLQGGLRWPAMWDGLTPRRRGAGGGGAQPSLSRRVR